MNATSKLGCALLAGAALALAGCGSSNDDEPAVTQQVPQSASDSVDGFITYLKALVIAEADTLEPVDISTVNPPGSDSADPAVLN